MNTLQNYTTDKIFTRLLTNKSNKNYWSYVSELRKRKTEAVFKKCVALTHSISLKDRILGVDILSQFGYPRLHKKEIINILFKLLETEVDRKMVSSIFYGISHNNEKLTKKQIHLICKFKNHKSVYVRHALVAALSTVEDEKAYDVLIMLSTDKDSNIRDWATFGLGSQNDTDTEKIRAALWKRISDKDDDTRFEAISGLAQRKDKRIKNILLKELENIDAHVSLVLESIEALEDQSFIPILEQKIKENRTLKEVNEDELLAALNALKVAN
ncbi:HEAT repeat domain-containing protein [Psychroserpens sp. NJDZ02]|uniref:HEAT repeat domain-containing protein n=1 Tax=Psychroserpens sp. NJDZ02 TaxID=2570561 RepID=UPI0010A900D3|nr:HEAT repeat domain-containing protein [Psychroserpens sp. NJDZ02]QCE43370.1 hypothetical protein E9099_18740 [Psychroserpens sp. NJDZ02]